MGLLNPSWVLQQNPDLGSAGKTQHLGSAAFVLDFLELIRVSQLLFYLSLLLILIVCLRIFVSFALGIGILGI
ncbi:hypothetical protein SLEP1_g36746 [Rubroshorea leprosula]|uniref:Uncharacterized protein n=1 Tax=Rubroshorea leprosula TaxID=152421 RepID=A0AAV5KSM6_9ROSI|nr:hypothetical protein SLEP1_g36746 [Rubroshorea leprosula]